MMPFQPELRSFNIEQCSVGQARMLQLINQFDPVSPSELVVRWWVLAKKGEGQGY